MGSVSVLVIGADPVLQVHRLGEAHALNGYSSWICCIGTIDRLPLKAGATGRVLSGRDPWADDAFVEKTSGLVGQARKEAIDIDAMRDVAGVAAGDEWDRAQAARGGLSWETFHTMFARDPADRTFGERYRAQPAVVAMREAGFSTERSFADWYGLPRQAYVDWARAGALFDAYHQVVHDGEPLIDNSEEAWMREMHEEPQPVTEYLARRHAFFTRLQAILDAVPGPTLLTSALVKV